MSSPATENTPLEPPGSAAGRYRIERKLASGGMGAVFVAFDHALGRRVALKRLAAERDLERRTRMFEREFHTLAGLKHPRIIEVFDYGIDELGPYYTMELLDGHDLRELAPLPYQTACACLRDVASSLALLHARRLLHRDLSARNVRVTSDGRAKLIDFGTLAGFGKPAAVVGTPPFVPPEAFDRQPLDQSADLYGLGALAYWLLTGRHAYPARTFDELPDVWRITPQPPSARAAQGDEPVPPIPPALDALVMALLRRNPLARPGSAAEVISRLSAVAGLPPDREPLSALSYLHGGIRAGHKRERARLRRRLKATLRGSGSGVLIEAQAGMGSANILGELATVAHVSGAAAVVVDAALCRGVYALARETVRALLTMHPDKAVAAMAGHEAALGRFSDTAAAPAARSSSSMPVPPGAQGRSGIDPREARLRTQAALLGFIDQFCVHAPLVLAVNDVQQADEASAAFLAALACDPEPRRLLLVLAYDPDEQPTAPGPLRSLGESCSHIPLRALQPSEVLRWVRATFGEIGNVERLADWLHETTGGNPQGCHDLTQDLIERGAICFAEGVWTLPSELSLAELPSSLDQALGARIARLPEDTRRLLSVVAVHRGPMPLERCLACAALESIDEPLKLLAELERHGLLALDDEQVRLEHPSQRAAVQKRLGEVELGRLHAALGQLLSSQTAEGDLQTKLDAGWHLLHGGQERRGADLLAEVGLALSYDADNMPTAIPALRAALDAFRAQGRSQHEIVRLLGPLALAGYYSDREVVDSYAEDALQAMSEVLGIARAGRLERRLGPKLGMMCGMASGALGFARHDGWREGPRAFGELVPLFVTIAGTASTVGVVSLDGARARRYIGYIEPLTALGPESGPGLAYRFTTAAALTSEDRLAQALTGMRSVLARLEDPRPILRLPEGPRLMMHGGALYTTGALESFREDPAALALADKLEGLGLRLFEMFAHQIRCNYHGLRGEAAIAEHYRRRIEPLAVQAGSGWQVELWAASGALLCARLTRDLLGVRTALGRLQQLASEVPSLRRHAKLAEIAHHGLREEWEQVLRLCDEVLEGVEPRAFTGWSSTVAGRIRALARLGQPERAREVGLDALSLFDAEDRKMLATVTNLIIELALVEAALSDFDAAAARIDGFFEELGERGGPLTRGSLHEARAQIALAAGDTLLARQHLVHVDRLFTPTQNPALIARREHLQKLIEQHGQDLQPAGGAYTTADFGRPPAHDVQELLRACEGSERFERALELLLRHTRGHGGWLYRCESDALTLLASRDAAAPPPGALQDLRSQIAELRDTDAETELSASAGASSTAGITSLPTLLSGSRYRCYLLCAEREGGPAVVAAALIAAGDGALRALPRGLLDALGDALAAP